MPAGVAAVFLAAAFGPRVRDGEGAPEPRRKLSGREGTGSNSLAPTTTTGQPTPALGYGKLAAAGNPRSTNRRTAASQTA